MHQGNQQLTKQPQPQKQGLSPAVASVSILVAGVLVVVRAPDISINGPTAVSAHVAVCF